MRSIDQVLSKKKPAEETAPEYAEKRFAPRRKDQTPGIVYLENSTGSFPCLVKDMSTVGAQLELREGWDNPFASGVSLNDRIRLVVRMHRVIYTCKIVRRGEKVLGVKFTAAPKPISVEDAKGSTAALAKVAHGDAKLAAAAAAAPKAGKTPRA
jgi:hypothetical protein